MDYRDEYAADRDFLAADDFYDVIDEERLSRAMSAAEAERDWDLEVEGAREREVEEREHRG